MRHKRRDDCSDDATTATWRVRQPWRSRESTRRVLLFAIIGALLYTLSPDRGRHNVIEVTRDDVERAREMAKKKLGVSTLTESQQRTVVEDLIDDEILYREALRLGLEKGDTVVRRRMVQKLLFLVQDLAGASGPLDDDELRAYYEAHPERYRRPATLSFFQIFYRERPTRDATALARGMESMGAPAQVATTQGDASALPPLVPATSRDAIARKFGDAMADALDAVPVGVWVGPLPSKFGWHMVWLRERSEPSQEPFDAVRDRVRAHVRAERRVDAKARLLTRLHGSYRVEVEPHERAPTPRRRPVSAAMRRRQP